MVIHGVLVPYPPSKPLRGPVLDPPRVNIVRFQAVSSIPLCQDGEKNHQFVLIKECHVTGYKTLKDELRFFA